jgi:MinD superfamily P-loop ATPase
MRDHLSEYWALYLIGAVFGFLSIAIVNASNNEQQRINYCFDRGMVLVDTPAGKRCAAIHSLEPVR